MMTLFDIPATSPNWLQVLWLILVAVLWIGFFFLEGFDFGVGMLVPFLGKNDRERRLVMNTIGPHWDGNEVWLLTAGGAMFAAFPGWYATLFSGLYLPLFLVLLGLIIRGIAIEYRSKQADPAWRKVWDWLMAIGSFIPALVFGVGFANFLKGLPVSMSSDMANLNGQAMSPFGIDVPVFSGTFWRLFMPFCLIGGLLLVSLFLTHGAFFVALKTSGEMHSRAQRYGSVLGVVAIVLALVFVIWGNTAYHLEGQLPALRIVAWITGIVSVLALAFAWYMNSLHRDGWAFIGTALATVMLVVMFFAHFYPSLGFNNASNTGVPIDLTTASSSQNTLVIMSWVALFMVPIVLAYTVWSYFFVFRRRLSVNNMPVDVDVAV
ncbi:MAG: cytochrome d ubiquinol oxidase subunit II [Propionibacteriaceae bacterium]|jgi:cytochrome d ubiquinol oxidase subunit II|nr:cytochrome d ubiquinol oxidase subunit II [Propionibacteriaceae bacterium]